MELKERAIYQLPNGRELVARRLASDKLVLYSLTASDPKQYELNDQGRLTVDGQLTAWEVSNLLETGRTAPQDLTEMLGDASEERSAAEHGA